MSNGSCSAIAAASTAMCSHCDSMVKRAFRPPSTLAVTAAVKPQVPGSIKARACTVASLLSQCPHQSLWPIHVVRSRPQFPRHRRGDEEEEHADGRLDLRRLELAVHEPRADQGADD